MVLKQACSHLCDMTGTIMHSGCKAFEPGYGTSLTKKFKICSCGNFDITYPADLIWSTENPTTANLLNNLQFLNN